jgi:hypothetical protein
MTGYVGQGNRIGWGDKGSRLKSLGKNEQVETVKPRSPVQQFSEGNAEFCFGGTAVQNFDDQQAIFDLESAPELLHAVAGNEHRVLLIELLEGEDPVPVYHDQPLLPLAQDLGLLEDLAVVIAVLDEGLRDARDVGREALVQLLAHIDEFLLDDEGEDVVVEGEVLIGLAGGSDKEFILIDCAELDTMAIGKSNALDDLDFVELFQVIVLL